MPKSNFVPNSSRLKKNEKITDEAMYAEDAAEVTLIVKVPAENRQFTKGICSKAL